MSERFSSLAVVFTSYSTLRVVGNFWGMTSDVHASGCTAVFIIFIITRAPNLKRYTSEFVFIFQHTLRLNWSAPARPSLLYVGNKACTLPQTDIG